MAGLTALTMDIGLENANKVKAVEPEKSEA
jgi:hypothetical protein